MGTKSANSSWPLLTSIFFVLLLMMIAQSASAWDVDFSRRQKKSQSALPEKVVSKNAVVANDGGKDPDSLPKRNLEGLVQKTVAPSYVDRQEVVILNTSKGFIPSNVRLHKGVHYTIHVVNVNEDKKNISFMLDAFDQHYATYYGQIRTFKMDPDKEGVFDFQCPETSSSGKLVVFGPAGMEPVRAPTSEK